MRFVLLLVSSILALSACGDDGGGSDTGTGDSGLRCMSGMHECDGECVTDQVNDPSLGCRRGCGDPCPEPREGGSATCTSSGLCDVMCTTPFRKMGDMCVCVPMSCSEAGAMCGMSVEDGCGGTIPDCGMCGDGRMCDDDNQCVCIVDDAEPNETELTAFSLGDFADTPTTMMTFSEFTLNDEDDVDVYRVRVRDTGDASPTIRVELRNIPPASNFELGAFYRCDSGGDATTCMRPMGMMAMDTPMGRGCVSENPNQDPERVQLQTFCDTTDESGNLHIEVRSTTWVNACVPYELFVLVE